LKKYQEPEDLPSSVFKAEKVEKSPVVC